MLQVGPPRGGFTTQLAWARARAQPILRGGFLWGPMGAMPSFPTVAVDWRPFFQCDVSGLSLIASAF